MPGRSGSANLAWKEHLDAAGPTSPPIVLIHGAGGSRLSWPPPLRRMPGGHVFSLDLPGHGEAGVAALPTVGAYAEVVLDWLRQMGLERVVLVGHSMGSAIALTVALRAESPAAGLVLLGSGKRLPVHPRLLELASSRPQAIQAAHLIVEWGFAPGAPVEMLRQAAETLMHVPADVLHMDLAACDHFDAGPRLGELRIPVVVVAGAEDHMAQPDEARRLAEAIPGARFRLLEGAGHMLMIEKTAEVAEIVREVLREVLTET